MKQLAYGIWPSILSAKKAAQGKMSLGWLQKEEDFLYWLQKDPSQQGRASLFRWNGKIQEEITPHQDIRSKINEYGGGAYHVAGDKLFFSEGKEGAVYLQEKGALKLLVKHPSCRYADFCYDKKRQLLYAIREEIKTNASIHSVVKISLEGKEEVIAQGYDFYASLALDPFCEHLAFLKWNHPNMPWDGCKLMLHPIQIYGSLEEGIWVAGEDSSSVFQPRFSPNGVLYFILEEGNWSHLYQYQKGKKEPVCKIEAEFAQPAWVLGLSRYDFLPKQKGYDIFCIYTKEGKDHLALLSLPQKILTEIKTDFTHIQFLQADKEGGYGVASSNLEGSHLFFYDAEKKKIFPLLEKKAAISQTWISVAQPVHSLVEKKQKIYGFFYPPLHPEYVGPDSQRPPLLVRCHGGPTMHVSPSLESEILFWTSRGFAVLEVNYRGSSGYGKAYREQLKGHWGIFDVEDVYELTLSLLEEGLVDRNCLAVKGRSAGGFTALNAAGSSNLFTAAVSYYGIFDLSSSIHPTPKFESHYLQNLVGAPLSKKQAYQERSPLYKTSSISCPILLLHGEKDSIVPKEQSLQLYQKLKKKQKEVYLKLFPEEGHGFRKADTIQQALEIEYAFYCHVFGLHPQEPLVSLADL